MFEYLAALNIIKLTIGGLVLTYLYDRYEFVLSNRQQFDPPPTSPAFTLPNASVVPPQTGSLSPGLSVAIPHR